MRTDQKLESLLEKAANGSLTSSEEKLLRQLQDGSAEIGAAATGDNPLGAEDLNQIAQANAAASTASMTGSATATTTGLSSIGSKLTGLVGPAAAGVGLAAVAGGGGGGAGGSAAIVQSLGTSGASLGGQLINGYIEGARVYQDINRNNQWDESEPYGITVGENETDEDGNPLDPGSYTIENSVAGEFTLIAEPIEGQTVDLSTGAAVTTVFKAPSSASVISPISTLVSAGLSEDDIKEVFGIDDSIDILAFDPVAEATGDNPELALRFKAASVQVSNILDVGTAMGAENDTYASDKVVGALVTKIQSVKAASPGGLIDLTDTSVLKEVFVAAAEAAGQTVDESLMDAASAQLGVLNNDIKTLVEQGGDGAALLDSINTITRVAQTNLADNVKVAKADPTKVAQVQFDKDAAIASAKADIEADLATFEEAKVERKADAGKSFGGIDFEDDAWEYAAFGFEGAYVVKSFNPNDATPDNPGLKFIRLADSKHYAGAVIGYKADGSVHPIAFNTENGDTTIKARIWTETAGVVARMEVSSSSEIGKASVGDTNTVAANVTLTKAGWNDVTFDFGQPVSRFVGALGQESVVELNADTTYNVITMFVDYENGLDAEGAAVGTPVTEEAVYYIDDIRVGFGTPEPYRGADPEPGSDRQLFSAVRAAKDLKSQFAGVEDFGSGSTFDFEATDPNEVYDRVFSVTSGEEFGVNVGFVAFPVLGEGFADGYEAFRFKASVPEIVEGIEIKLIGGSKESAAVVDGTFPGVTDLGNGWYDVIVPLSEFSYSSAIPSHTGYLIGAPGDYGTEQITLYFTDIKLEGTADNYPTSLSELVAEQSTDGSGDSSDSSAGSGLLGEFGGINFETPDGMSSSDYITDAFEGASVSIATDPTDADNQVLKYTRGEGSKNYAGSYIGYTEGAAVDSIPFDIEAGNTTIAARIWTPTAGLVVRMEVADSFESGEGNDTETVHTEATLSQVGWNDLVFDFSAPVARYVSAIQSEQTVALAAEASYDKIGIFIDWENGLDFPGDPVGTPYTEDVSYYIDDIRLGFGDPSYYTGDPRAIEGLDLIFADEFNAIGEGPDSASWGFDIGTGSNGWGNNESQVYENDLDDAQIVDIGSDGIINGALKITAQNVDGTLTSARVKSKIDDVGPYGYYEIRAKLPSEEGAWPAIWLLGDLEQNSWPATGEIDIVEWSSAQHDEVAGNEIISALHFTDRHGGNPVSESAILDSPVDDWHTYQLWWMPDSIKIGVDGTDESDAHLVYQKPDNATADNWPYTEPMDIIMNVALGGTLGGTVPSGDFNYEMFVDYVRIYRPTDFNYEEEATLDSAAPTYVTDDDVAIALYSNALTADVGIDFPDWGQSGTLAPATGLPDAVGDVLKFSNLNYQGIQLDAATDVSTKEVFHLDLWSTTSGSVEVFLISTGPVEHKVTLDVTAGEWNSFDLDLAQFADAGVALDDIIQVKFNSPEGGLTDFYMDNLFFDSGNQVILDFETDNTLHDLTAFDGSSHEILTASQPAGSDGDVLKITKGAVGGAGETWAGTVLTVLEGTDLITPYSSSVTIDVLAPADDIAVLLKLENGSDYEEVEVSTASDGVTEWETLTFDFSSADHNVDYEKATLIFQNGVQGEGEEYYVDNVTFGGFIA